MSKGNFTKLLQIFHIAIVILQKLPNAHIASTTSRHAIQMHWHFQAYKITLNVVIRANV